MAQLELEVQLNWSISPSGDVVVGASRMRAREINFMQGCISGS